MACELTAWRAREPITNCDRAPRPGHESGRDDQGAFATVDTIVVSHRLIARVAM